MTEALDEVAQAWAEQEAARAAYHLELRRLRDSGLSARAAQRRIGPARHRLIDAWALLHRLGEVELHPPVLHRPGEVELHPPGAPR